MKFASLALASLFGAASVLAQTLHTIQVGANQGVTYNPNQISGVQVGDTISFVFMAKNHTVTQSSFANPCTELAGGIDSGFMPVSAALGSTSGPFPTWSITVQNTSKPLWFYCRQTLHCEKGMVFAVNPTDTLTFNAFQSAAMALASGSSSGSGYGTSGATARFLLSTGFQFAATSLVAGLLGALIL